MINIHNNNQTSFLGFANNTVRSPEHCQALAEPSKQASKPISHDRVATFMLYIQSVVTCRLHCLDLSCWQPLNFGWFLTERHGSTSNSGWKIKCWSDHQSYVTTMLTSSRSHKYQHHSSGASSVGLCLHKQFQSIFKHANTFLKTQAFTNIPRGLCNPSHTTAGYSLKMRRRHTVFTKCPHLLLMSWELRSERKANWSSQKWKYKAAHMLY